MNGGSSIRDVNIEKGCEMTNNQYTKAMSPLMFFGSLVLAIVWPYLSTSLATWCVVWGALVVVSVFIAAAMPDKPGDDGAGEK
jgi:hypothetical protein